MGIGAVLYMYVQNLLLILYNHIKTICTIIQRLFGQNEVITAFDGCT